MTHRRARPSVIILGAGLAGLSAGYALKKQQHQVTILEARDRIGGRVDTRIVSQNPRLAIEMGGEWIGERHHHMHELCKELHLKLVDHHLKTSLLYDGKYFGPRQWSFSERWKKKLKRIIRQSASLSQEEMKRLDGIDWWHFLVANHVPKKDLEIIDLIGGTDSGEDIRFVSALDALTDAVDDHDCARIQGGNWALTRALARHIGEQHIKLGRIVTTVHQTDGKVAVTCRNGEIFHADVVLSTVPASTASQIHWHPQLPDAQQEALKSLDYCRIMKISLLFRHRFWRDNFEIVTDTLADYIYHSTQNQDGEKGVLTAYAVGDRAYVLSNMSDEEKIDAICRALKIPFGDVRDQVEGIYSYYWGDDPYVGGAYALFEKNHPLGLKKILREPYGHIYFAGEHTADCQGFMEGAVESGMRAAKSIEEIVIP